MCAFHDGYLEITTLQVHYKWNIYDKYTTMESQEIIA